MSDQARCLIQVTNQVSTGQPGSSVIQLTNQTLGFAGAGDLRETELRQKTVRGQKIPSGKRKGAQPAENWSAVKTAAETLLMWYSNLFRFKWRKASHFGPFRSPHVNQGAAQN
jgi:hypothetical protein